jgi:hypothetical protein
VNTRKIKLSGRLVPTQITGVAYQVAFGMPKPESDEAVHHGKGMGRVQWTKCSVQPISTARVPDGRYFLYTDDGKVRQLKSVDGKWQYLAMAA